MNYKNDTIVSKVTPEGRSSVGIIRVSGNLALKVSVKVLGKKCLPARYACYSSFLDSSGMIIDQGIVLWFPSPFSFTGEDVLELQGHGNPIILDLLLSTILTISGVRLARPGEFSERAFLNGKIDLIQAESISDLINATSNQAARSALLSLKGVFSTYVNTLIEDLIKFRVNIEAYINFSDDENEDEKNLHDDNLIEISINKFIVTINKIKNISIKGSILREGIKVVISGDPNSGKSSLLNALSLTNRSIVTDIPGTTRDLIYEKIIVHGIEFTLIDTAGLRKTNNLIERIGIQRAWDEINTTEHVLFVIDGSLCAKKQLKSYSEFMQSISKNINITVIFNKFDSKNFKSSKEVSKLAKNISVSCCTGFGIEKLRHHLYDSLMLNTLADDSEGVILARRRHISILLDVLKKIKKSKKVWENTHNLEFLANDLRVCQNILGGITGVFTSDQLLSDIFSEFCIGK